MRGILMAGGKSTRLYPTTVSVNKHLLPVYDKPMIYYSLSLLMLAGIREIMVISDPKSITLLHNLLCSGEQWGVKFEYREQDAPNGIADAFRIGADYIGGGCVCLVLGDNIFYGHGLPNQLRNAAQLTTGARIFAYHVVDPARYGVVEFDSRFNAVSIEEKPIRPKSHYAIPGVYFYDNQIVDIAANLIPSNRGELEITDVNKEYIRRGQLSVEIIGRGTAWLDAGTHESLLQAANFVQAVEERQGIMVASPEEIAYRLGYITKHELYRLATAMQSSLYGQYIMQMYNS